MEKISFLKVSEHMSGSSEDHSFAVGFSSIAEELFKLGKLHNHPVSRNAGGPGLDGVIEGLKILKEENVCGSKLVYTLIEHTA